VFGATIANLARGQRDEARCEQPAAPEAATTGG
jgi:hypothetical protein